MEFNMLGNKKKEDEQDQISPVSTLTETKPLESSTSNANQNDDYIEKLKQAYEGYNKLASEKPEESSDGGYKWGTHLGTALQGWGNALSQKAGKGNQFEVGSLYKTADEKRKAEYQNLLDQWKTKLEASGKNVEAVKGEYDIYKGQEGLKAEKAKADQAQKNWEANYGLNERKTAAAEEKARKYMTKSSGGGSDVKIDVELPNGSIVQVKPSAVGGLVNSGAKLVGGNAPVDKESPTYKVDEARRKIDVENLVAAEQELPKLQARINEGDEIIGLLESGETSIGGWSEKAGAVAEKVGTPIGNVIAGVNEATRSTADERVVSYLNNMLLEVLAEQKGPQTDSDKATAMKIQGSPSNDPEVIAQNIRKVQALARTKIENTIAAQKYIKEHGSLQGFVPKSTDFSKIGEPKQTNSSDDLFD